MSEDVVIVGAGPAGLACAKGLAERGIEPLVFEKEKFGHKPCGDLVTGKWFGYSMDPFLDQEAIEREFDEFIINFYGKVFKFKGKWFSIDRKKFERSLYREAKEKGARFRFRPVTKIERKGDGFLINDQIEARYLVGADGTNSLVRRFLGQKIKTAYAIRGYADMEQEKPTMFVDKEIIRKGYAWIFPKKEKVNIGVVSVDKGMVRGGWKRFTKGKEVEKVNGGFVPVFSPRKFEFKNALLIGDAASFGEIHVALICGELASRAIANGESYEKLWKEKMWYRKLTMVYFKRKIFGYFLMDHRWAGRLLRFWE